MKGFGVPLVDGMVFEKPMVISAEKGMVETAGNAALIVSDLSARSDRIRSCQGNRTIPTSRLGLRQRARAVSRHFAV